jgi:hypothetical protein
MIFLSRSAYSECSSLSNDLLLATFLRYRRQQMMLTLEDAADLAGLTIRQWKALESGWVPAPDSTQLYAIAGTLEVNTSSLLQLADISRTRAA